VSFEDFAPQVFAELRSVFGIATVEYLLSLGPERVLTGLLFGRLLCYEQIANSGRSGSIFFRSPDGRYFLKTLPTEEDELLRAVLPSYRLHVVRWPASLLTRFCGLHRLTLSCSSSPQRDVLFVVMENMFHSRLPIHEQYDLKGSTVGRHVAVHKQTGTVAGKDLDFHHRVRIGADRRARLLEQIERDCKWMEAHNICDYSLLLGIHFVDRGEIPLSVVQAESSLDIDISDWTRRGIRSLAEDGHSPGNQVYFMGIIDNLTEYNFKKKSEHHFKSLFHDSSQISAIPPTPYRIRFLKYVASIMD